MNISKSIAFSAAAAAIALAPLAPAFAETTASEQAATSDQTTASDQTPANAPTRRDIKAQMLEKRATIRENVQQKKEQARDQIQQKREQVRELLAVKKKQVTEKRKQLIREHFTRMMKRFDAALERIKKIGERIQSRIDKARANGKDTANAQTALDRAKASWQEARSAVDGIKGKLEGVLSADDPKAAFKDVQNLIEAARDKIKAAHAAMVDAITALKGVGGGSDRATTAPAENQ